MIKILAKCNICFLLKSLLIFLLLVLLTGCFSLKPTGTKSGKSYFETFYVGEEGTQYFIKPIVFESDGSKEDLAIDITFRYKNALRDSARVNFTIKNLNIYRSIDSLKMSNNLIDISSDKVELLFNEKAGKAFVSRFTTKIPLVAVKELFDEDDWTIITYNRDITSRYDSAKKSQKAIRSLRHHLFVVIKDEFE